jgi:hypothetical protein
MEVTGSKLFEVLFRNLPRDTEKNHETLQLG